MGALIALWLQGHRDKALEKSITENIAYVYRELFDKNTGDVYNDIAETMTGIDCIIIPEMCIRDRCIGDRGRAGCDACIFKYSV